MLQKNLTQGELFAIADIGSVLIPFMICAIVAYAFFHRCNVYSAFTEGIADGGRSLFSIFPSIFALFIAVSVFRASGLVDFVVKLLSPICSFLHFPADLLPFAVLRPVSGSGSLAMASDIFQKFGPDSFEGRLASVMMGSTETTFYTVAVYFGASGTKNIRHSLKCALAADVFSMAVSLVVCLWYFY